MSEFTDKDRETQTKTLTLLEQHVKLSDERHCEMKRVISDHEIRIRKNEGVVSKVAVVASFVGAGVTAGITTVIRKITG